MIARVHMFPIAPYSHRTTLVSNEVFRYPSRFLTTEEIERIFSNFKDDQIEICFPSHFLSHPQVSELRKLLAPELSRTRIQIQFGEELNEYQELVRELSRQGFNFDLLFDRAPEETRLSAQVAFFAQPPRFIYLQNRLFPYFLEQEKFPANRKPAFNLYLTKKINNDSFFGQQVAEPPYVEESVLLCDWISEDGRIQSALSLKELGNGRDFLFVRASSKLIKSALSSYHFGRLMSSYVELLRMGIRSFFHIFVILRLARVCKKIWLFATTSPYAPWMKIFWFLRYQYQTRLKCREKK